MQRLGVARSTFDDLIKATWRPVAEGRLHRGADRRALRVSRTAAERQLEHNPMALNRKGGLGILKVGRMGESPGG
jgi:hypothetical protein